MKNVLLCLLVGVFLVNLQGISQAQEGRGPGQGRGMGRAQGMGPGQGMGRGRGMGRGMQRGHQHDDRHEADHEVFEFLLRQHKKIKRTVKELPDGVETLTESDNAEVAAMIKDHVQWMEYRVEESNPIRMRDPLFAELFKYTDKIKMKHEDTEKGVRVVETSDDPKVAKLIQAHAKVVSKFVENGFAEAMKNHAVPTDAVLTPVEPGKPVIDGHGKVVRMATATHQPRDGSKVAVDITRGGSPGELNSAIEKVAKYLNIFAAAGAEPARGQFAMIFHGDATLAILHPEAYAKEFGTEGNPNVKLLRELHEAGVEMIVCGQTLTSKGKSSDDVLVFVEVGVSALTANVNLQQDGYAFIPLGN
ncbi:DsrE family protein [Roseiconus lacunae]|uniref:DsrE family protein n=1 Tax=Roseiconus lacunae TaxID=2605694 RepID=UPI001E56F58F|nr:DsrE family protein [Roseiconus lacunae]MCD0462761.1 DsrE family protein [Roseiconus lacunae]